MTQTTEHKKITPGDEEFWSERGIDFHVRLARPYVRYYPDDTTPVQHAYATLRTVGQKATMSRHAGQAAGILINRHAALPGLDPVPAEMRPGASCVLSCVPCGCAHRFCNHKRLFRPSAPSADLG